MASPPSLPPAPLAGGFEPSLTPPQLQSIKSQLDLTLLALEALVGVGSEAMLAAAAALSLDEVFTDRVGLWRLRQANPLRRGRGRKTLDIDEAKALVCITCHIAANHHQPIRRAVTQLETALAHHRPPHRVALIGDYLDTFTHCYQERMEPNAESETDTPDQLAQLALKLLVDLLFYSTAGGERQLWLALLERSR